MSVITKNHMSLKELTLVIILNKIKTHRQEKFLKKNVSTGLYDIRGHERAWGIR